VKDKWWRKSLAPLRDPNDAAAREEKADLEEAQLSVSLPTAFAAYKSHKLYALERFLLKFETIHPRGPILGYCKGEPVFRRDCVQTLKTQGAWIKEGRSIKTGEVCVKLVKSRAPSKERAKGRGKESALRRNSSASSTGSKSASGRKRPQARDEEDEEEEEEEEDDGPTNRGGNGLDAEMLMEEELANAGDNASVELFGFWQTEPYKRPVASGGVVPVNSFGNVDLYRPEMLPINTVHLTEPGMASLARELRIHFADAVVGFDFAAGRSFPVKEGIVVCAEFAQLLREVWTQKQQVVADKAAEDRTARVLQRWGRLVSQYLLHKQLKARYFSKS
jgi:xeroderma pigmentosum group C-complementing protein